MPKTDGAPDAPEKMEFETMDMLPVGTEVMGTTLGGKDVFALRGELYDGQKTWYVDGWGTYRTRALMTLGYGWRVVNTGVHEV